MNAQSPMALRSRREGRRWSVSTYSTTLGQRRWSWQWSWRWAGRYRRDGSLARGIGPQFAVAGWACCAIVWPPTVEPVTTGAEKLARERAARPRAARRIHGS